MKPKLRKQSFPSPVAAALFITALTVTALSEAADTAGVDGTEVLDLYEVSDSQRQKLENGEVLNFDGKPYESSSRELATDATVLINQPLPAVLSKLTSEESLVPSRKVLASGALPGIAGTSADFSGVIYEDSEKDNAEVERLLKARPGKEFNFSRQEWDWVTAQTKDSKNLDAEQKRRLASDIMRHILEGRYRAYTEEGIEGIAPVYRGSKEVDVSNDLRKTTDTHKPIETWFPDYYKVLSSYPEGADCCEHIYRWLKVKIAKRPTFALTHTIVQKSDNYLLYTERFFYLNNAGNYGQVLLAWLPYEGNTYMGLAMSANTEVLDSLLGKMLRSLGRNMAGELVGDVLLDIKTDLEAGEAPGVPSD